LDVVASRQTHRDSLNPEWLIGLRRDAASSQLLSETGNSRPIIAVAVDSVTAKTETGPTTGSQNF
jgi:hypothetical protein